MRTLPCILACFAILAAAAPLAAGTGDRNQRLELIELFSDDEGADPAVATRRQGRPSFLDDATARNRRIRGILLAAAREGKQLEARLAAVSAAISATERRLAARGLGREEERRLVEGNLRRFEELENLRLSMVDVQLRAARQVLAIQSQAQKNVARDVKRQLAAIKKDPAAYWLWRREQVLTAAERADGLTPERIRALYR